MNAPAIAVTVLRALFGKRLVKIFATDRQGRVIKSAYNSPKWFASAVVAISSVDGLADLLGRLQKHPDACIIMGAPGKWHPGEGRPVQRRIYASQELVDDVGRFQKIARKGAAAAWQEQQVAAGRLFPVTVLPMFEPQPTRLLLLDADKLIAPAGVDWRADLAWTASYVRHQLPVEFHACRCVYYATGSAADLTKPDLGGAEIRMRLGFVLDRGVTPVQAKRWLADVKGLDKSTLNPAQPIYTAAPQFHDGLADPMPERLGMLDGARDLVPVPEITVEQRFKREAFASLGPIRSAEGLGLVNPHPRLDAALERLGADAGASGSVRSGLLRAAFAYIADAGRDHVDIDALAEFLTQVGEQYRSAAEVAGYGLEGMITWALERAPGEPPPRPHYPENGLPGDEATARLRQEMAAAVASAAAWQAVSVTADGKIDVNLAPPVVGIKAGAGLGKTGAALEQIAAIAGVEQMNIEIYVPDHRLALEHAERARAVAPHLGVLVIRGRGAADTDGEPMCQKADLADQIGKAGLNVMGHLCRLKAKDGGQSQQCEFAHSCRYLAKFRENRPAIRILPHASMFVARNEELPEPDLIVIDESFWRDAVSHERLALDRLTEVSRWRVRPRSSKRFKHATEEERLAEAFGQVKARKEADDRKQDAEFFARLVRSAFEDGRDPRTVVTAEEAGIVASVEWGSRGGPSITPGMEHKAQVNAWRSWQQDECAKAGRFWNLLAAEHEHPDRPLQRIVLERDAPTPDGDRRHLLHLHHRRDLSLPLVPVILLDADLDPVIAAKFWPDVHLVEIPVRQQAEIVQVVDRACSMQFLLGGAKSDQPRADNRLRELERFTGRILADGGLFVSYKAALDRIKLPAGVDGVHLGNLRGRDSFKHHDVAVIAGRLEPSVGKLEEMARAMFGDEAEPIATVAPGAHGGTRYPTEQRRYRMAAGAAGQAVAVSVHPDPRVQALLEQVRERELEQAVARLRLVHRDRPATVYLLTNLPLNLEIATLTTWNALARDREAEACQRWGGLWLCSAGERAKAAPDLWATAEAARPARAGKGWSESSRLYSRGVSPPFPHYPAWGRGLARDRATLVEYRYPGQRGSPHPALVPGELWCPDTARAYLEPVLGPVAVVTVVRTVHRAPIVDDGEPEPLAIPMVVSAPSHVLDVDEAWAFAGHDTQRWALANGRRVVLRVQMAQRFVLAWRPPDKPTSFARATP